MSRWTELPAVLTGHSVWLIWPWAAHYEVPLNASSSSRRRACQLRSPLTNADYDFFLKWHHWTSRAPQSPWGEGLTSTFSEALSSGTEAWWASWVHFDGCIQAPYVHYQPQQKTTSHTAPPRPKRAKSYQGQSLGWKKCQKVDLLVMRLFHHYSTQLFDLLCPNWRLGSAHSSSCKS